MAGAETSHRTREEREIDEMLTDFRDNPTMAKDVIERVVEPAMERILKFIIQAQEQEAQAGKQRHLFCDRVDPTVRESATFLLRLHAYEASNTNGWLNCVWRCIQACYDCSRGHEEAKRRLPSTYLSAYPVRKINGFMESIDNWERERILVEYAKANFLPTMPADDRTIQSVPPHLLYHLLVNINLLQTPRSPEGIPLEASSIAALIQKFPPRNKIEDFPANPPPGVLLFLFHEDEKLRTWAQKQTFNAVISAKDVELCLGPALSVIIGSVEGKIDVAWSTPSSPFFLTSQTQLWTSLYSLLQTFSPEALLSLIKRGDYEWTYFLTRHLHDPESHFPMVLQCFVHILHEVTSSFWTSDSVEFSEVVYDSIKDNPAFGRLLEAEAHIEEPWFLTCFQVLLLSVWDKPVFDPILAKVINFMSEELQHPRFEPPCRALVMQVVLSTMAFVHNEAAQKGDTQRKEAITQIFAIQATNIAGVAFTRQFSDSAWERARNQAVSLLRDVFEFDVIVLDQAVVEMCSIRTRVLKSDKGKDTPEVNVQAIVDDLNKVRHTVLHPALWEAVRKAIPLNDTKNFAFLVHFVAPSLHLALDPQHAFHDNQLINDAVVRKTFRNAVERVNAGISAIRIGFGPILAAFAEATTQESILTLLESPDFVKDILRLILCPLEDVSLAAQDIITQASFAPERMEVFRFLLTNSPESAIDGIVDYLQTFNGCAAIFPEVCGMARWMVRCLADVVDALCDPISGVLRQDNIVNNPQMPKRIYHLWRGMCRASSLIFKHTSAWAPFYATSIMTDWMRDALIFVRDLVRNLQVFESAIRGTSREDVEEISPAKIKLSSVGRKCVGHLSDVLLNLVSWLRLTDAETLHQSTELICELLKMYRRTHLSPPQEAIDTIEKKYALGGKSTGRLTREQSSSLTDAITPFVIVEVEDEEDEVTFISHIPSQAAEPAPPVPGPSSKEISSARKQMDIFSQIQPPKVHGFKKAGEQTDVSRAPLVSAATIRERSFPKKPIISRGPPPKPTTLMGQMRQDFRRNRQGISVVVPLRKHEPKNEGGHPLKITGESETSAEEGSSDSDAGQHYLSRLQKSPVKPLRPIAAKPPPKPERRQVQLLEAPNTSYNPVLERLRQREAQARRQKRLKPELGSFTRQVLLWDYEDQSEVPPYPLGMRPKLSQIPWLFDSYDDYRRTFEPFLMYECWSGIVKSKEDPVQNIVLCDIGSRSNTDDWLDLDVGINTDNVSNTWFLMDTDVVLLKQHLGHKSLMAKVESFRRTARGVEARLRCCLGNDPRGLNAALQIRTQWKAHKVFSFTTIYREYAALQGLSLYDMCDDILKPKPARLPKFSDIEVGNAMKAFEVNEPQANAILGSMQGDGFTLIQGPPGTGKTKTICGLVGCWLSKRGSATHPARPSEKPAKSKILICAPSNAAIDEVARRIKDGVRTSNGQRTSANVVRVGADAVINVSVKDISLDELIERKINADVNLKTDRTEAQSDIINLRRDIEAVQVEGRAKQKELSETRDNGARAAALEIEIKALNQKRMGLTSKLNQMRDKQKDAGRTMDAARRRFRQDVLDEADVICCTLSGSGHELLSSYDFETVVIDEAAQSVEMSSLIPLKYQCKRCILVGDPEQLPPTVLSQIAEQQGYSRSLFVRIMHRRPEAVHLLSIQYRMHPEISALDSAMFYDNRLKDGPGMAEKTAQPWHADPLFSPYRFFDVDGQETKARAGHSLVNDAEASMILGLFGRIRAEFPAVNFDYRIGIVTMYREQMFKLRRMFRDYYGEHILTAVDFNTVDGFQGQEKDIIILSCVRAGPNQSSVGFLADRRRTNVAITRARSNLFIFGNAATLERSDAIWKSIVQNAQERNVLMKVDQTTFRQRRSTPAIASTKPSASPRKPRAEAPKPPLPELMTPKEIAKAKQNAGGKASNPGPSTPRDNLGEEGEIADQSNPPLKRKASDDGPRRPPPALRRVQEGQKSETMRNSAENPSRNGSPAGPSGPGKRKQTDEGSRRPPPNLRSPYSKHNNGKNSPHSGGYGRRKGFPGPSSNAIRRVSSSVAEPPLPTLGNPIAVPSNEPPPQRRPFNNGGSSRPLQRLAMRGDGTTSETMFMPKKRTNNPNAPLPSGPSNAKQRLIQQAQQQHR
ncbi:hypothetical protein DACRYDRAFT_115362 [Dacryopinax primogenitus]|uniref:Helicase ATP-binding domain-containing protein n=1 Tax=Dacryopinax primogenitus (strain DJM 731) TaxID=1858805 RepID=M5FYI3_DACPD|nr:uncharacterized protein DACRYDRAFT_115362 [Dacryopinax primogenitus]EJU03106.1 hypothetical protein DACRYDRAFT_115362 [Dacryopinax primogenitus]